ALRLSIGPGATSTSGPYCRNQWRPPGEAAVAKWESWEHLNTHTKIHSRRAAPDSGPATRMDSFGLTPWMRGQSSIPPNAQDASKPTQTPAGGGPRTSRRHPFEFAAKAPWRSRLPAGYSSSLEIAWAERNGNGLARY